MTDKAEPRTRLGRRSAHAGRRGRTSSRRTCLGVNLTVAALFGVVAVAAGADGVTEASSISVISGSTAATLSYDHNASSAPPYSHLRLSISGGGHRLYSHPVEGVLCGSQCWPAVGIQGDPVLRVADIEGDGSPDAVLSLYSGGAHCCFITQVYRYDEPVGTYSVAQRDFGDAGAVLRTIAARQVFVSADDRFAYSFAPFAFSGLPLRIWSFAGGHFADVTRSYPQLIEADAARQYRAFTRYRSQRLGLGFVAAWAADEDLLGHETLVARRLSSLRSAGALRSADSVSQSGAAFVAELDQFLAATGYRR
jgi:hypothetical protein